VVLPPQRRARPPPYTGKVLKEKADSWWHDLSPSSRQDWLESALLVLKSLADAGLGAASVLVNLHHWRIVPLVEREIRVYEMSEAANPTSLARSWFFSKRLPQEYTATRARRAISLKAVRHSNNDLWSFVMLPDAPPVSGLSPFSFIPPRRVVVALTFHSSQQRVAVNTARSDPPTPRPERACCAAAGAGVSGAQEGAKDPVAGALGTEGRRIPVG
jgi:hypothetical protein